MQRRSAARDSSPRDLCIIPHLRRHFRDSGLVMCVSTLPSPSLSVPCIWCLLQRSFLMHTPADPAGAKPRRDHRSLARVSRHKVPKTAGKKSSGKIYDPARVSHLPSQSISATPWRGRGLLARPGPRVFGATPLDPWLNTVHPCRGASFPTLHNELMDFCAAQMRHPGGSTAPERRENRGDLCIIPHLRRHFRDSGLVMCVSTLPSPSLSVPCIWCLLQSPCRKSDAFSAKDHFAKVFRGEMATFVGRDCDHL